MDSGRTARRKMQILISGSSGLIGSALVSSLASAGHSVTRLVRSKPLILPSPLGGEGKGEGEVHWDPSSGTIEADRLEGFDAVVHLAGDPIAAGRWTPQKKAAIRDSRVKGTRFLSETLANLKRPPKALLCASAIGYYGNRGEEILREESASGSGFLAEVGREWEEACQPALRSGIRVVHLRFGIVLSTKGGALAMMLPPFQMGMGGKLGSGKQHMSWIALDDVAGAIQHILTHETLRGAVNVVAPHSVTNLEFTKILGKVLGRPTIFPVPGFAVRLLFGELADEALLASARVEPARLLAAGYRFHYPQLEGALTHLLRF